MVEWIGANAGFVAGVVLVNVVVAVSTGLAIVLELVPLRRRRGHPLADVAYDQAATNMKRFLGLFVAIQLGLGAIFVSAASDPRFSRYMLLVYVPTFLLSYSVFLFFRRPFYDRMKEAIQATGRDVLVDFNHKVLRTILNWQLEVVSAAALMLVSAIYFDWDSVPFLLPPMLLMLYASIWHRKYFLRGGFGYWYKSLLFVNLFVQALKGVTMVTESLQIQSGLLGAADYALLTATGILVAGQLLLSYMRAPEAWRSIQESVDSAHDQSPSLAC